MHLKFQLSAHQQDLSFSGLNRMSRRSFSEGGSSWDPVLLAEAKLAKAKTGRFPAYLAQLKVALQPHRRWDSTGELAGILLFKCQYVTKSQKYEDTKNYIPISCLTRFVIS